MLWQFKLTFLKIFPHCSFFTRYLCENLNISLKWNSYFFSSETTEKNPQFNFSCQDLSLEHNSFKWDGKVTSLAAPSPSNSDINTVWQWLFHRILEKNYFIWLNFQTFLQRIKNLVQFSQTWFCFVQVCTTLIVHHIGKYVSYMLEAKVNFGMKIKMLGDKKGDFWGL